MAQQMLAHAAVALLRLSQPFTCVTVSNEETGSFLALKGNALLEILAMYKYWALYQIRWIVSKQNLRNKLPNTDILGLIFSWFCECPMIVSSCEVAQQNIQSAVVDLCHWRTSRQTSPSLAIPVLDRFCGGFLVSAGFYGGFSLQIGF